MKENQHPHANHSLYLSIFSFSPIKFSVTDFSSPMRARVFKFVYPLISSVQVYCGKENQGAEIFFFFHFPVHLSLQCNTDKQMKIFSPFSQELKGLPCWNLVHHIWTICWSMYKKNLSLQLIANIKSLHLQNCFNISLMAVAWGMWACAHCLLYFLCLHGVSLWA